MVSWLAARSDGEHYGELVNFTFPRGQQLDGPEQVEARIDNDPRISEQFTLWGQVGSEVLRGNLLVIPIENTILYVEPIFLQAERLAFPELKQVIVADARDVVMRSTLTEALAALTSGAPPAAVGETKPPEPGAPPATSPSQSLQEAVEAISGAVEGIQDQLSKLQESLEELRKLAEGE
jgi:hypothetical protein